MRPAAEGHMPDPLDPRRKRVLFRAAHRGTKEADLLVGGFTARAIATLTPTELDQLERILDLPDADLVDWLSARRPPPPDLALPLLDRMIEACTRPGAGLP